MSLSPEVKLRIILKEKAKIRKASDEISAITKKLGKGTLEESIARGLERLKRPHFEAKTVEDPHDMLGEEDSVAVRQKLHAIVSSLSTIASFCDKGTQSYVQRVSRVASETTAMPKIDALEGFVLESFCTMVNSVIVDFNKTPFTLSGEFRIGFDRLMAAVRAKYKKGK